MSATAAPASTSAATENLPLFDWAETRHLVTSGGKLLERWGSVRKACAVLDGCRRQELYDLIDAGLVQAYKLKPDSSNSHWRVDLLSVWKHKTRQLSRA